MVFTEVPPESVGILQASRKCSIFHGICIWVVVLCHQCSWYIHVVYVPVLFRACSWTRRQRYDCPRVSELIPKDMRWISGDKLNKNIRRHETCVYEYSHWLFSFYGFVYYMHHMIYMTKYMTMHVCMYLHVCMYVCICVYMHIYREIKL